MTPADLVAGLAYKPGWTFKIGGPLNTMLCVFARTPDSNNPARERTTQHMFQLPEGFESLPDRVVIRWAFESLLLAERHECGEFFRFDGHRPFLPNHQDEGSPYVHVERWPDGSA